MPTAAKPAPEPEFSGWFNRRIERRMKQLGMTKLEQFAEYSGIGATTVYGLVQGRVSRHGKLVKPSLETLAKLADALEVPLHELVYELEPTARGAQQVIPHKVLRLPVRVAGWVGAGPRQDDAIHEEEVWIDGYSSRSKELLAFRVRGDSMAMGPKPIFDGDLVVVNRKDKGHHGSVVVARLDPEGYVCKLLRDDMFGRQLVSSNPRASDGTPLHIDAEDVAEIVGRVVEVRHFDFGASSR
ncbi:MAG TPA: LexA family transcriptional regulator [Trueperaceae bacterium]